MNGSQITVGLFADESRAMFRCTPRGIPAGFWVPAGIRVQRGFLPHNRPVVAAMTSQELMNTWP